MEMMIRDKRWEWGNGNKEMDQFSPGGKRNGGRKMECGFICVRIKFGGKEKQGLFV